MRRVETIPALTSFRFVAAFMIVIHHTNFYFKVGTDWLNAIPLDQGVSFFFVLSGFVLYLNHNARQSGQQGAAFVAARIARIWPLHMATLALTLLFLPSPWGSSGPALGPAIANMLLIQSWIPLPSYFFSYNAPAWSLSAELFFYISYPALVFRFAQTWHWKLALCLLGALAMMALSIRLDLGFYGFGKNEGVSIDALVYINPIARIGEFAIGLVAAHAWLAARPHLSRLDRLGGTLLEAAGLAAAGLALTALYDAYGALVNGHLIPGALGRWLLASGSAPAFAILIVAFASARGLFSRLFAWRPLVILGECSFALYLCHMVVFRGLLGAGSLPIFGDLPAQLAGYLVLVIATSYALHRTVERPGQRVMLPVLMSLVDAQKPFPARNRASRL